MSAKESRRRSDRRDDSRPSVVGSKIRGASGKGRSRALPKGGIRERDGLKVAEGALPDSTSFIATDGRGMAQRILRIVAVVSGILIILFVALGIALAILANTSALSVTRIETFDSEHISADEVARLAQINEDVTLLNVDEAAIEQSVKKNPWVASVHVEHVFPDTLRLHVTERKLGAVVAMSSGGVAWLLGDDNVWIEPYKFEVSESESVNDAALTQASSLGVILISDVPTSVNPTAGSACNDGAIQAVMNVANQLSDAFKEQVVCYSASSEDDIACILKNGVEISLGSNSNIETKEAVALQILEQFSGQITYINVRTPSRPTYRRVDSEYVREGTGATGSATDEQSVVPKVEALEGEESDENTSGGSSTSSKKSDSSSSSSKSDDKNGQEKASDTSDEYGDSSDYEDSYGQEYYDDSTALGTSDGYY